MNHWMGTKMLKGYIHSSLTAFLLLFLVFHVSCNEVKDKPNNAAESKKMKSQKNAAKTEQIDSSEFKFTYDDHIEKWLDEHCISCHGPNDKYDFSTYKKASAAAESFVKRIKDTANPMPPADSNDPISDSAFVKISTWTKNGTPKSNDIISDIEEDEKDTQPSIEIMDEVEFAFTYEGNIKSWLDHHCISCHGPNDQYNFSTYENTSKYAEKMLERMSDRRIQCHLRMLLRLARLREYQF